MTSCWKPNTFSVPVSPLATAFTSSPSRTASGVGLLLWCAPPLHLKDRDAWIGWDPLTRAQRLKLIVNQARFLIPNAARRPNLASQILAAATAALPDQWLAHCGYAPLLAETFTDPEAHAGTCYKAAGWEPTKTVFECVAARPSQCLHLLAKRAFP